MIRKIIPQALTPTWPPQQACTLLARLPLAVLAPPDDRRHHVGEDAGQRWQVACAIAPDPHLGETMAQERFGKMHAG
jgi:hypothetical protein